MFLRLSVCLSVCLSETESGTVPPLAVERGQPSSASNHRVAFTRAVLPRLRSFKWITHHYRYYNNESVAKFGQWRAGFDWAELVQLEGSNQKSEYYQAAVTGAMNRFFPMLKVRCKICSCPQINDQLR